MLGSSRINELLRKAGMAEETKQFQDDKLKINTVGGKDSPKTGTKIIGGGGRAGDIKTLDKHPKR